MIRKREDNHRTVHAAIAKRVLASPVGQSYGHPDDKDRYLYLRNAAEGNVEVDTYFSYHNMVFRRAGSECSLGIKAENLGKRELDEHGNEWQDYTLKFVINYPCHGACEPSTAIARAKLVSDVATLAAELAGEFSKVTRMLRTAEQRANDEVTAKKNRDERMAKVVVLKNIKALPRGHRRHLPTSELEGISPGTLHRIETGGESEKWVRGRRVVSRKPVRVYILEVRIGSGTISRCQ